MCQNILIKALIKANKYVVSLLIIAFLVNIAVFFLFRLHDKEFGAANFKGDSKGYVFLSENLINYKFSVFSMSEAKPLEPDTLRTPGYPVFLALVKIFFHTYLFVIFLQILMSFGMAWLIFEAGRKIFSEKVGFLLGTVFLFDPLTIFATLCTMSDVIFSLIFVLITYLILIKPVLDGKSYFGVWRYALYGIGLGISILIRPFALYLAPVLAFFFAIINYTYLGYRKAIFFAAIMLLATGLVILPWMMRNLQVSGRLELSSISSYHLYWSLGPEYLTWKYKISQQSARDMLQDEARKKYGTEISAYDDRWKIIVFDVLSRDGFTYIFFHLVKTTPFFLSSPLKALARAVSPEYFKYTPFNLTTALFNRDFAEIYHALKADPMESIDNLVRLTMVGLAMLSIFCKKYRRMVIVLLCLTGLVALMCVPISNVRYRLPVQPLILLLDAIGIYVLLGWYNYVKDRFIYKNINRE